jgi:hypothetical protein
MESFKELLEELSTMLKHLKFCSYGILTELLNVTQINDKLFDNKYKIAYFQASKQTSFRQEKLKTHKPFKLKPQQVTCRKPI